MMLAPARSVIVRVKINFLIGVCLLVNDKILFNLFRYDLLLLILSLLIQLLYDFLQRFDAVFKILFSGSPFIAAAFLFIRLFWG